MNAVEAFSDNIDDSHLTRSVIRIFMKVYAKKSKEITKENVEDIRLITFK